MVIALLGCEKDAAAALPSRLRQVACKHEPRCGLVLRNSVNQNQILVNQNQTYDVF